MGSAQRIGITSVACSAVQFDLLPGARSGPSISMSNFSESSHRDCQERDMRRKFTPFCSLYQPLGSDNQRLL